MRRLSKLPHPELPERKLDETCHNGHPMLEDPDNVFWVLKPGAGGKKHPRCRKCASANGKLARKYQGSRRTS